MRQKLIFLASILFITFGFEKVALSQWVKTNGSFSSWEIDFFAARGNVLFAGSDESGIYRSTDNGENWALTGGGLDAENFFALGVIGTYIFAGTDGGLYRSIDSGASWTVVNPGIDGNVTAFILNGTNLFAGTSNSGVFVSTDSGGSWTAASVGLTIDYVHGFAVIDTDIFVGTGSGVFLSTNNGLSWKAVNNGLTNISIFAIASNGKDLFAGCLYPGISGVFRSTDNGNNWVTVDSSKEVTSFAVSGTFLFVSTANRGVFLSKDSGTNWMSVNTGLTDQSLYVPALLVNEPYLFAGATNIWRRPLSDFNQSSVASQSANDVSLRVWPSIAATQVMATLNGNEIAKSLELVDAIGQTVYQADFVPEVHHFEFPVGSLPSGLYIARVMTDNGERDAKIIVKH